MWTRVPTQWHPSKLTSSPLHATLCRARPLQLATYMAFQHHTRHHVECIKVLQPTWQVEEPISTEPLRATWQRVEPKVGHCLINTSSLLCALAAHDIASSPKLSQVPYLMSSHSTWCRVQIMPFNFASEGYTSIGTRLQAALNLMSSAAHMTTINGSLLLTFHLTPRRVKHSTCYIRHNVESYGIPFLKGLVLLKSNEQRRTQ